jgi:deoxyguanosine kinase
LNNSSTKNVTEKVATAPHRFIVVEGPIGVGKTSLARRLARSFGSELVLEQADENPFLERFYRNPRAAALQTQLFFLFQRTRQLEDIRQHDLFETVRVADYLLDKDRLFAQLTLDEEELGLYEQVYARLAVDVRSATSSRSSGSTWRSCRRRTPGSSTTITWRRC